MAVGQYYLVAEGPTTKGLAGTYVIVVTDLTPKYITLNYVLIEGTYPTVPGVERNGTTSYPTQAGWLVNSSISLLDLDRGKALWQLNQPAQ